MPAPKNSASPFLAATACIRSTNSSSTCAKWKDFPVELWQGDYDNYISEIMDDGSGLYAFAPQVVFVLPAERRCAYTGKLTDPREMQQAEAQRVVDSLLELARKVNEKTRAEVITTNFMLPARHDLGAFRSRTLGSDWTFPQMGQPGTGPGRAALICTFATGNFLPTASADWPRAMSARGSKASSRVRPRCWWNLPARSAHLIASLKRAPKKVLVLDLDNTLWGGVVADDGLEGIELGDTSPRGEAFKAFQKYIASLKQRGVLLAVCSKNDFARAAEPFEKHPEMVLQMDDIVSFKANWEPKSENIRAMAPELNLGLDSFVFVDDNPAEIEIVRQFVPEVTTILLGPDPADYVAQLADCRLFEPRSITSRGCRAHQPVSLRSAAQGARGHRHGHGVVSRIASDGGRHQRIHAGGRATPVAAHQQKQPVQPHHAPPQRGRGHCRDERSRIHRLFSVRLKDRFGDHGLISIVIGKKAGDTMQMDTWLMSCRVLKRQVEEEVLNELARLAKLRHCVAARGRLFAHAQERNGA